MYHRMVKVAAAVPVVKVADCMANADRIFELIAKAEQQGVEVVCFPELSITSYSCADLFFNHSLLRRAEEALDYLLQKTQKLDIIAMVGMPIAVDGRLFNVAVAFCGGDILGVVPKTFIPNNNEFYEQRWFASGELVEEQYITLARRRCLFGTNLIFTSVQYCFSIELCEDLWSVLPPSSYQALAGSHIVFNLSASNEIAGKHRYRRTLVEQQSGRCNAGYVYVSAGFGESSTDVLFASSAMIAENGTILAESKRFALEAQLIVSEIDIERLDYERLHNGSFKNGCPQITKTYRRPEFKVDCNRAFDLTRKVDAHPFVPQDNNLNEHCHEIFNIQTNALVTRLHNTGIRGAVIGVSGGLDSTLALLVTVEAFDCLGLSRSDIIGITMPGFGTTSRTKQNSLSLMKAMGITIREISIENAVLQHFEDIGHNPDIHDTTYENSQARQRTMMLMNIANKANAIVVGTGDMSELALGWCTYNGDHMSMYGVNSGVPKTLVKHLVEWIAHNKTDQTVASILSDIVATPISPELLPHKEGRIVQKTEDIVGPYELHDFYLYHFLRFGFGYEKILFLARKAFDKQYEEAAIEHWLKIFMQRFFGQQFKRSCMPDGIKVGSVCLSPRGDLKMPSDVTITKL